MSHSHHGGGSSSTGTGTFKEKNRELAEAYWYLVASAVGLAGVVRAISYVQVVSRRRKGQGQSTLSPSRPTGPLSQLWATTTALAREASYPQVHVPLRYLSWISPPPLGRVLILLSYWAVVVYMMAAGSVVRDAYFWERIAFRNAWVSVTQVPLVYMLAMKSINPVSLLTGLSHERLNWLHRWVARTLLVTATVHGFHFWRQWVIADFVALELKIMPSVKYGLGAWAVLLWSAATSLYPVRERAYEVFVAQHLVSVVVLLWLLYMHLPPVAAYNLWLSVGLIAADRAARWGLLAARNVKLRVGRAPCEGRRRVGHEALVRAEGAVSVVTIKDMHFHWQPGQHLYLWMPALGPLETHPYTIACAHRVRGECVCNSAELVVRKHSGFSRRLHAAAWKAQEGGGLLRATAFVSGPYGNPPAWDVYDTVILIAASTGASFTMPILEDVVRCRQRTCLRRVEFALSARENEDVGFYVSRLREALEGHADADIKLRAHVAITGPTPSPLGPSEGSSSPTSHSPEKNPPETVAGAPEALRHYGARLDIASIIRGPVEAARGETLVVVCGGRALVARVRNCVARLSDERGVHKGTGAQGIRLHAEEYSF